MAIYDQKNEFDIHQYQWSFIDNPPTEEDLCSQCAEILNEPMLTECCGTHLCRTCAEPSFIEGKLYECPGCNQRSVTCILDRSKWKNILHLKVKCPMKERGCLWTGDIQISHDHLHVDCKYLDFDCSNGCGESLERHEIVDHLENECPQRSVTCQYCNLVGTLENIVGDHLLKCPKYLISCPNGCGEQMKRSYYDQHSEYCTELIVPCPYKFVGCSAQSERKVMPQHLKEDNQNHAHLQMKFIHNKLEKSNAELIQKMEASKRLYKYHQEVSKVNTDEMIESREQQRERTFSRRAQKIKNCTNNLFEKIASYEHRFKQAHEHLEHTMKALFTKLPNILWEIDSKVIQFECRLYSGQFSEVWKGIQHRKRQVAIKKLKLGSMTSSKFQQEAYMLSTLDHYNILKLHGVSTSEEPLQIIVTEYLFYGNLINCFNSTEKNKFSVGLKIHIIEQVASGMAYLWSVNCIHRSITSRAILVGNKLHCKIGSFSLARKLKEGEFEYHIPQGERVPIKWSAPEALIENKYSIKSDVWSFGVLQYEIMSHQVLKMPNSQAELFIKTGFVLDCPKDCEEEHYKLIVQCWSQNPDLRPSISVFLNVHTTIYKIADVDFKDFESALDDEKEEVDASNEGTAEEGVIVESELPKEDHSANNEAIEKDLYEHFPCFLKEDSANNEKQGTDDQTSDSDQTISEPLLEDSDDEDIYTTMHA